MADRRSAIRSPKTAPVVEGTCRDLGHAGEGIVETSQGVVFVPFAIPGETVRIGEVVRAGKVARGVLREVLSASPSRVTPPCTFVQRCGGCPLMAADLEAQCAHKLQRVTHAAGVPATLHVRGARNDECDDDGLGYRQRARFAFDSKRGATQIGFRPPRSHQVIDIDECVVLDAVVRDGLVFVRQALGPTLAGAGELSIAVGFEAKPVVWLETTTAQSAGVYGALHEGVAAKRLAGAALRIAGAGEATMGDASEHTPHVDGMPLIAPSFGFSQAHGALNAELIALVDTLAAAAGRRVLELYAGAGNLSMSLARRASALTTVESSRPAVAACTQNLAARGLHVRAVLAEDAAVAAARMSANDVDVVVLDPPRTGAREVIPAILALAPERIVYVSCDPPTLARDLHTLVAGGFRVSEAHALDMFPHTAHVEAVVALVRG